MKVVVTLHLHFRNNLKQLQFNRKCIFTRVQLSWFPMVPPLTCVLSCSTRCQCSRCSAELQATWITAWDAPQKNAPYFGLENHPHGFHAIASCIKAWLLRASHNELQTAELCFLLDPLSYHPVLHLSPLVASSVVSLSRYNQHIHHRKN